MALVNTDLFLVQDATTKTNYKYTFEKLTLDIASDIDLDAIYVKNDGDNITGDITLGPDGNAKITLDAANGDITLTGTVYGTTGQFTEIDGYGGLEIHGDPVSGRSIGIDSNGNTTIDKTLTVDDDATLNAGLTVSSATTLNGTLSGTTAQFNKKIDGTSGLLLYSDPSVQTGVEIDAAGNVNLGAELTVIGDTSLDSDLTVTGDTLLADVVGDKFTGTFSGDGSDLTNLPVIPGLWQKSGSDLSPMANNSNLVDIVDITVSGQIEADRIDGGEYI